MLVTINAANMVEAREAAVAILEALDIGHYHFVQATASRTETGRKIEITFKPQER